MNYFYYSLEETNLKKGNIDSAERFEKGCKQLMIRVTFQLVNEIIKLIQPVYRLRSSPASILA